jgi:Matrixin
VRRGYTILLLGLLSWGDPASAQKRVTIHPLTVSIHKSLETWVTPNDVEQVLKAASDLLQQSANNCMVGFKLQGKVTTFDSGSAPASIDDAVGLEKVHSVPAKVKVVQHINFCIRGSEYGLVGCSWRPNTKLPKTVVISAEMMRYGSEPMIFAHEYGHVAGLPHRDDPKALMTPCVITALNYRVNALECGRFNAGPPKSYPQDSALACGGRTD